MDHLSLLIRQGIIGSSTQSLNRQLVCRPRPIVSCFSSSADLDESSQMLPLDRRAIRARKLLGIPKHQKQHHMTSKDLRLIYLEAAKKCHPDMAQQDTDEEDHDTRADKRDFKEVTEAYELLQRYTVRSSRRNTAGNANGQADDDAYMGITERDEQDFRVACENFLGVPAEAVEESKKSPIFRAWLEGHNAQAQLWRNFFALHGGLAPMLRPVAGELDSGGDGNIITKKATRRKKK